VNASRLLPHLSCQTFFAYRFSYTGKSLSLLPIFSFLHLVIFFISRAFYGAICVHGALGRCTSSIPDPYPSMPLQPLQFRANLD
jgi:hypothetical protein